MKKDEYLTIALWIMLALILLALGISATALTKNMSYHDECIESHADYEVTYGGNTLHFTNVSEAERFYKTYMDADVVMRNKPGVEYHDVNHRDQYVIHSYTEKVCTKYALVREAKP